MKTNHAQVESILMKLCSYFYLGQRAYWTTMILIVAAVVLFLFYIVEHINLDIGIKDTVDVKCTW